MVSIWAAPGGWGTPQALVLTQEGRKPYVSSPLPTLVASEGNKVRSHEVILNSLRLSPNTKVHVSSP